MHLVDYYFKNEEEGMHLGVQFLKFSKPESSYTKGKNYKSKRKHELQSSLVA